MMLTEEQKNYIRKNCNVYNSVTFEHTVDMEKAKKFLSGKF